MTLSRALLVVDVQNDFCEGGSLAVTGGAEVAAAIDGFFDSHAQDYDTVLATADWHEDPGKHFSDSPDYVDTWPVHCVAGTLGAAFHPAVTPVTDMVEAVFRKGRHTAAYSGFEGTASDGGREVGLAEFLHEIGITAVDIVGIATDHCVRATALDAVAEGFATRVLCDLTAGVSPETTARALTDLREAGVELVGTPRVG